jgi:hypothetical protein
MAGTGGLDALPNHEANRDNSAALPKHEDNHEDMAHEVMAHAFEVIFRAHH